MTLTKGRAVNEDLNILARMCRETDGRAKALSAEKQATQPLTSVAPAVDQGALCVTFDGVSADASVVSCVASLVRDLPCSWTHVTLRYDPRARECWALLRVYTVEGVYKVSANGATAIAAVERAVELMGTPWDVRLSNA